MNLKFFYSRFPFYIQNSKFNILQLLLSLIIFLLVTRNVLASLRINEIYPAPPSGEFEWVELYNDSDSATDTAKFTLTDLVGNKLKFETATIAAFSFAIASSSSVLNNTGDTISLKNNLNEILEVATYSGTFSSEDSYGKCPDFDGPFFKLVLPSKNASNLSSCIALTPTPLSEVTVTLSVTTPTNTPTPIKTPTLTRTPTPKKTLTPTRTLTPTKIVIYTTQKTDPTRRSPTTFQSGSDQDVLGEQNIKPPRKKSVSRFLSFLSAAYSLLTATSVLIKIKFNVS